MSLNGDDFLFFFIRCFYSMFAYVWMLCRGCFVLFFFYYSNVKTGCLRNIKCHTIQSDRKWQNIHVGISVLVPRSANDMEEGEKKAEKIAYGVRSHFCHYSCFFLSQVPWKPFVLMHRGHASLLFSISHFMSECADVCRLWCDFYIL